VLNETFVVLDLETTGPKTQDEILEIGAVKIQKGQVVDSFNTLVRPKGKIPLRIKLLTGITDEMVADAPELNQVLPDLVRFLGKNPLVGHNIAFDYGFITRALGYDLPNLRLDTVDLARIAWPLSRNHRLSTLTSLMGIEHQEKHRAMGDARATGYLFLKVLETIQNFSLNLLISINRGTKGLEWPYGDLFRSLEADRARIFPEGKLTTQQMIMDDNEEEGLFYLADEPEVRNQMVKLDLSLLRGIFGQKGPFVTKLDHYEYREPQVVMVEAVGQAFNDSNLLLMEAGTGTGKSLAYLVPSLLWAVGNDQRVVIATHTINLQEQLWEKDIPLLKDVLNRDFRACLVKGRNNYICLRKWQGIMPGDFHGGYKGAGVVFWARILSWLAQTTSGDRSQLNLSRIEQEWWGMIAGDSDICLGHHCTYFQKHCFIMKARQQAERAHLLIVNHSLLLTDIKTDNKVLPPYRYLIIDEAHHLEDEATQHLGTSLSLSGIMKFLGSLSRNKENSPNLGFLGNLRLRSGKFSEILEDRDFERFEDSLLKALDTVRDAREGTESLFTSLGRLAGRKGQGTDHGGRIICRIFPEDVEQDFWQAIYSEKENLVFRLRSLVDHLKDLHRILDGQKRERDYTTEMKDLQTHWGGAVEFIDNLNFLCNPTDDNYVYWLETDSHEGPGDIQLKSAPVMVGNILCERLLKEKETIVFASATLTMDGSFDYFMERVGLNLVNEERVITRQVSSPFNYENQALLCITKDLPNPAKVTDEEYQEAIAPVIADLIVATGGRTLVLFTSHKMLRETYYRLLEPLEEKGICLLGHNIDGSRSQLLGEFQERPNSVIFGANSFWEGVDLPGDVLSSVIIVKIPFAVPTLPTVQARLETLQRMDKDSFKFFSLPHAVIRMKQGFGRLIRTKRDYGVIIILDRRVISQSYGKYFLRSLPVTRHFRGEKDIVVDKVVNWLNGEGKEQPRWQIITDRNDVTRLLKARGTGY